MNKRSMCCLALLFLMPITFLRTANAEVNTLLFGGFYLGGDTLVDTSDDFDLDAGNGLHIGTGLLFTPENSVIAFQFTVGYKFDYTEFERPDGDASISSFPLEFMVYLKQNKLRMGAGIAYHLDPEFEFCLDNSKCNTTDFDDSPGYMIEAAYDLAELVYLAVRYTDMEYEANNIGDVDASNLGVNLGFKF